MTKGVIGLTNLTVPICLVSHQVSIATKHSEHKPLGNEFPALKQHSEEALRLSYWYIDVITFYY